MMPMPLPLTRDLVLIGGGHAHALVARMWGMKPLPGVRVTLINPGPTAPYSGMLPGHIAGHYTRDALDIDLVKLARFAGARLILGAATAIDPVAKTVTIAGRGQVGYDIASVDVGIHAEMPAIPGFSDHATGAKPLDTYAARWRDFLARAAAGEVAPEVAVIGGGVAGSELALAMAHALRRDVGPAARVALIEAEADITANNPATRRHLADAMERLGVTLHTSATVTRIEADRVLLASGAPVRSHFTVGAAGAFAHGWLADSPLPTTPDGFLPVDETLRVAGHDSLFAVGDCAHMPHAPRPKAGVFAVRAGPVLYRNLAASLSGGALRAFRPQKDYLKLVSLGGKAALAEKWGKSLAAPVMWRWKDRIDQKFMDKFRHLPEMTPPALPDPVALGVAEEMAGNHKPLCAGCGAKVGPGTLAHALATLPRSGRDDVLSGPGDDAAVLQVGGATQVITTDHLRAFSEDHGLFARIAAVHALGDIWAMGASPQAALVSVILPRMAEPLQARSMAEIMQGAGEVFGPEGAEVVGGHSSMGAEMTLGFTLTGLVEGAPISTAGARAGDALILTRPIGSGTILAAEMQGKAAGADVAAMLAVMATPQGDAARLLAGAHAMTDVTGFGLAGHLMAICAASKLGAEVQLDAVPVYAGALDLASAGHRSSIFAANRAAAPVSGAEGALGALLHDPQTSGGLLAAVDPDQAFGLAMELRAAGHQAAVIGTLVAGPPMIRCVSP
ncbi:selenide, water dikinase SelD [Maritimibacter fusiformis]|uniref:Selenide, water dikinase SelD n=2 Tax=Maritimibacter fusiformis TaxID=2603819 RepID=A0A5D0RG47_9RHOB|nr:selenide, water dikinase SelD [Maritimibacter fusiformis]TYB80482.1 selenide, water dikinase SelD [Maritimibacter fusiformis]